MPSILVVDDYADTRELLTAVLGAQGYEVFTAADGAEGLEVARQERPHVIIMDIFMPVMDGLSAVRLLKADPTLSTTPVIAYTARHSPIPAETELFAAVCRKPCPPDVLLSVLRAIIDR